jgi:hypothetical protein
MRKAPTWAALAAAVIAAPALAQKMPDIGFQSVGRGRPLAASVLDYEQEVGPNWIRRQGQQAGPDAKEPFPLNGYRPDAVPKNYKPLPRDIYTSDDFYKDKELWSDPRYFRCNSPQATEYQRGVLQRPGVNTSDKIEDAPWGHCEISLPREAIVSPYGFKTAQEHYEALLNETRGRGGPTKHTYATVPGELNGRYIWPRGQNWYAELFYNQTSTILSLLTPDYQTRMVQELYHDAVTNAPQWPAQYCWPEGFMRRWHYHGVTNQPHHVLVTPDLVQVMAGDADNFITNVHIGRSFNMSGTVPRLGADVPRWLGETIGFWDGDVLITWTSNIQGWKAHGNPEFSNALQTIEIYTPNRDADGNVIGINHEGIFYDPEALAEPVRMVRNLQRLSGIETGDPFTFIECLPQMYPVDGRATPTSPGDTIEYKVPDMFGRPWGQIWEEYHEAGMEKPEVEDIFSFE